MDAQIGQLNATLKNLGVDPNTLPFYTADNGPETSLKVRDKNIPYGRA